MTPDYGPSQLSLAFYVLCVASVGAMATCLCSLQYLRRVRMERPPIGTFNGRDIAILIAFLAVLPELYLLLPRTVLTSLLAMTFVASLSIGLKPLLSPVRLWLVIGVLLGADIWLARTMLGTVVGWQVYWTENAVIVLLGAVSVANLYVQGGMKLRHVAWFALVLAGYDLVATLVFPTTNTLTQEFLGFPLDPSIGMRFGLANATIGLGDLLVYALFVTAAFKAHGRSAARLALALVFVFGVALPAYAPVVVNVIDARGDSIFPAQAFFGPAAYVAYRWMRNRYGTERTMKEFLASSDMAPRTTPAVTVPAAVPEHAPV
jgi:hypothetical protein